MYPRLNPRAYKQQFTVLKGELFVLISYGIECKQGIEDDIAVRLLAGQQRVTERVKPSFPFLLFSPRKANLQTSVLIRFFGRLETVHSSTRICIIEILCVFFVLIFISFS